MNILEKKVEGQVQFWSILGPFLMLSAITVLLFKVSAHWYFPLSALIGIPLCVKWKMKGMAVALSCLFLCTALAYQSLALDERYWHVGMGLAIAFSFIILTLSLEEVESVVGKLQLESQSRLENFLRLDEKWKAVEGEWIKEKELLQTCASALTVDLTQIQEEKQTFYKLAQLTKEELIQVREQHGQLHQELFYKKQQIAQLNERLEETEMTLQGFVDSDTEKQLQLFIEDLTKAEKEKDTFKIQVERLYQEKESLLEEAQIYEESVQKQYKYLEKEKDKLFIALTELQQRYEQLMHIESAQKQTLQQHQKNTTLLKEELSLCCTERESLQKQQKNQVQEGMRACQEVERLQGQVKQQQENVEQLTQQLESLEQLKAQEGQLYQQQLASVQQQLEQTVKKLPLENETGNTRRIETMYIQLKEQFQEKSQTLDATRRELFRAEEQVLSLQKDQAEEMYAPSLEVMSWQKEFLKFGKWSEQLQQEKKEQEGEIEELVTVIGCLLRQIKK